MLPRPYYLLANNHTKIKALPINDATKTNCIHVVEDQLILGWHNSVAIKPNQYLAATLRSFFLIFTPSSVNLGVPLDNGGANTF